jgi:hypothetical protein
MIRISQPDGWLLIDHRDHARLAGEFAARWNNPDFAVPEPRADVITAVARHDDAWAEHDAAPGLTREGRPSAFSQELVGSYSAFEEMDFQAYLRVRGRATETVAVDNPYAAIVVSMHTVNLLTEQADRSTLTEPQLALLAQFIATQRTRQVQLAAAVAGEPGRADDVAPEGLQRAFEFLQACDSLSLMICVNYPQPLPLRHRQPRRSGRLETLTCTPLGARTFRVSPWPFDGPELRCTIPARRINGHTFADLAGFRAACAVATPTPIRVTLEQ